MACPKSLTFVVIASVFVQSITGQCASNAAPVLNVVQSERVIIPSSAAGLAQIQPGLQNVGLSLANMQSNRGSFLVQSVSPISPTGINLQSDNTFEGSLDLAGQLPFLSSVALEGGLSGNGVGSIAYTCGGPEIGITNEVLPAAPAAGVPINGVNLSRVPIDARGLRGGLVNARVPVGLTQAGCGRQL